MPDRERRAHEERPRRPHADRRRQQELHPHAGSHREQPAEGVSGKNVAHRDRDQRDRQRDREPEPTAHVAKLGVLRFFGRGPRPRLERHPANGARARHIAHDLRVHGASPLPARGGGRWPQGLDGLLSSPRSLCNEGVATMGSAKHVGDSVRLVPPRSRGRVDGHSAHGIDPRQGGAGVPRRRAAGGGVRWGLRIGAHRGPRRVLSVRTCDRERSRTWRRPRVLSIACKKQATIANGPRALARQLGRPVGSGAKIASSESTK